MQGDPATWTCLWKWATLHWVLSMGWNTLGGPNTAHVPQRSTFPKEPECEYDQGLRGGGCRADNKCLRVKADRCLSASKFKCYHWRQITCHSCRDHINYVGTFLSPCRCQRASATLASGERENLGLRCVGVTLVTCYCLADVQHFLVMYILKLEKVFTATLE